MKHSRRISLPFSTHSETLVRQRFELMRQALRTAPPGPASPPTPADWVLLDRIQALLDYAFTTGDWHGARREIEVLKRRAQIRIVAKQSSKT